MKHTPGPWTVEPYRDGYYKLQQAQDRLDPEHPDESLTKEVIEAEDNANAIMMEAAPELLEQLEAQTNWFIACHLPKLPQGQQKIWWDEIGNPAQAAIAKAKGG